MKVPNAEKAWVDIRKLTDYCLNPHHEIGKHKAAVFERALDLSIQNAKELYEQLLVAVKSFEAQIGKSDKFGKRFTVDFEMIRGNKKAIIRSAWIITTENTFPVLTTCFIL